MRGMPTWMAVMCENPISAIPLSVGSQTASFRLSNDWSDRIPTAPMLVPGTGKDYRAVLSFKDLNQNHKEISQVSIVVSGVLEI